MSTPLISVIVPVYNVEKYLAKCLDALINQTFKHIEIICINDGSTDNSETIAKEYAQKDNRIHYIYQENQGLGAARNTGIEAASANYLMFCDSDDWYDETMCEKMYKAISENDVDFACCGIQNVYDSVNTTNKEADLEYYKIKYKGVVEVTSDVLHYLDVSSCNKIMKKELLNKYVIRYPTGLRYEDYCLFFQLCSVSKAIYCLPEYLYYYRRRSGSIMTSTFGGDPLAIDHLKIFNIILSFVIKHNLFEKWEKDLYLGCLECFCFAYRYLPENNKEQAFDLAISFMKTVPQKKIKILSEDKQNLWKSILNKTYLSYEKKIKIGKITLVKISKKMNAYKIHFLGIQVFCRKFKDGKLAYYILHIPVKITKIKERK